MKINPRGCGVLWHIGIPALSCCGACSLRTGSGSIDADELRMVLGWCLRESAIVLPEERLGDLTLVLFEAADKDRSGSITFEELKEELEAFPEVMENLTIR